VIYCQSFEKKLGQLCILKSSSGPTVEEPDDNRSQLVVHTKITTSTTITTTNNSLNPINQQNINSVSTTVSTGGQFISHGILVGADKLSKHIESGAEKLKGMIDPNDTPAQVPDNIKHTLSVAKRVTPLLVDISGMLVKSVHTVVKGVGNIAAEQIKAKISTNSQVDLDDPKVIAAKNLGRTTAHAIITIWNSLEDAGMILLSSTGKATVNVVDHKYGKEAAKVTADGFSVAQDVVQTGNTLKGLGVKGLVKGVAKETTKNLIGLDEHQQNNALPPTAPQGLLLPATPNNPNK